MRSKWMPVTSCSHSRSRGSLDLSDLGMRLYGTEMETEEGLDARLSKAYRQLFGESENDMSAEEIARLLSAVPSLRREAAILHLSTLRRLFSESESSMSLVAPPGAADPCSPATPPVPSVETLQERVRSTLTHAQDLIPNLISLLSQREDHFVLFCTSKALCALLLSRRVVLQAEWITRLAFAEASVTFLGVLYGIQLVTEMLKAMRKQLTLQQDSKLLEPSHFQDKHEVVFHALRSSWHSAFGTFKHSINFSHSSPHDKNHPSSDHSRQLHLLAHSLEDCCTSAKSSRELWQSFDAFLDLTVEALRHLDMHSSSGVEWLCNDVPSHIRDMAQLVVQGPSLIPLKRLLDVLAKLIGSQCLSSEVITCLVSSLPSVLNSTAVRRMFHTWMQAVGGAMLCNALGTLRNHQDTVSLSNMEDIEGDEDTGLVQIIVRKLALLLLKFVVAMGSESQGGVQCSGSGKSLLVSSLEIVHSHLADYTAQTGLTGLTGRRAELIQAARSVLLELLSEQDDSLVEALTACCHLSSFHHTCTVPTGESCLFSVLLRVVEIHSVFTHFLSSIAYDHSIILDLLISSETNFRAFLADYLQLADSTWDNLLVACEERDRHFSHESIALQETANSETSSPTVSHNGDRVAAENSVLASPILPVAARTSDLVALSPTSEHASSSGDREASPPSPTPKRFKPTETRVEPRPPRRASSPDHSPGPLVSVSFSVKSQPSTEVCADSDAGRSETRTVPEHCTPTEDTQSTGTESPPEERSKHNLLIDEKSPSTREREPAGVLGSCRGEDRTLDRVMDCLTKLRFVLGRLEAQELSPFPAQKLVALLVGLEERYEQ